MHLSTPPTLHGSRRGLLVAIVAVAWLALAASSALAAPGHKFSRQFGEGQLASPAGLAIAPALDRVFVADSSNRRVQSFTAAGDPVAPIDASTTADYPNGVAYDIARDRLYVAGYTADFSARVIAIYRADGSPVGSVDLSQRPQGANTSITGIAVNQSSGTLYVASGDNAVVDVYDAAGTRTGVVGDSGAFTAPSGVAVGAGGSVYVSDSDPTAGRVQRFVGGVATVIDPNPALGVATDPSNGDVYVAESAALGPQIVHYSGTTRLETFGAGRIVGFGGLAVEGSTHNVLVADNSSSTVQVYIPFVAPGATTGAATDVTPTSATVNGTVDTAGRATTYRFEYGTDTNYGNATSDTPVSSPSVSEALSGLQPNTTYHYRLVASNVDGSANGEDQTFTTPAAPPLVDGQPASATAVGPNGATLNGTVNPQNSATTAYIEYGTSIAYGSRTADFDAGAGNADVAFSADVSGLQPEVTYHFRVVASNAAGETRGTDQTFTTTPALPTTSIGAASDVAPGTATFHGSVDTQGLAGTYSFFVKAINSAYSASTSPIDIPAGTGSREVSASIGGLPAGGRFEVRLKVTTTTSSVFSGATTFATPAGAADLATPVPPGQGAFSYGCTAPRLNAVRGSVQAGKGLTLTGSDFGTGGNVLVNGRLADATSYTPSRVRFTVPSTATGTVSVLVGCGRNSNTIRVKVASPKKPSNRFSLKTSRRGSSVTLRVSVPGRGEVKASGKYLTSTSAKPTKKGSVGLKLRLTKKGQAAIRRAGGLKVKVRVRYRPAGGTTRTASRTVSFPG